MDAPNICAYKGSTSQTGQAALNEFPTAVCLSGKPSQKDVVDAVQSSKNLGVLPLWNSHVGEIKELQALELLFQQAVKLLHLWPATIRFPGLRKTAGSKKIKAIVSVHVAEIQCSKFIDDHGADFVGMESTVDAYREFKIGDKFDCVLCAPGQNVDGFVEETPNAANPLNFTTFSLLVSKEFKSWPKENWGAWKKHLLPSTGEFFATEMPIQTLSLSEEQQQLLTDITADAKTIDDIPKPIFISRRREDSYGILFEVVGKGFDGEIITEDGYTGKVTFIPEIGVFNKRYSERLYEFWEKDHASVIQQDFVRHVGKKTCFFACPPLQLITHGFEIKIVEPIIKRIISKYFELYVNGIECSPSQRRFFEKYKKTYLAKGADFIKFYDVGI